MAQFSDEYQDDPAQCFPYHHPDWDKPENWYFTDMKSSDDTKRYNTLKVQFQKQLGMDEALADNMAFLMAHSRFWTVKLPAKFKVPEMDEITGEPKIDPKTGRFVTMPHPFAGQTPPLTLEYIDIIGEAVWVDALNTLIHHYGDQFPKEDTKSSGTEASIPNPSPSPDA